MLKVINIKDKKYIFLPNSITLLKYHKEIDDTYHKMKNGETNHDNILKDLIEKEEKVKNTYDVIKKDYYNTDDITISGCDINLLYECNLRCRYCFVGDNHENLGGILSKEKAFRIIDYIFEHRSPKDHMIITLMGGEPLMNIEVFKDIMDYAKLLGQKYKKSIKFITTTNAILLDEENISIFEEYNVGFIMSLDSHKKKVNDYLRTGYKTDISVYDKVLSVIKKIKNKFDVCINVTITPLNLDIFETAKFLYEKGVKNIHFYLCDSDTQEMLFTLDHIERLKNEYDRICDYILEKLEDDIVITCQPLTDYIENIHYKKPIYFPCSTLKNRVAFCEKGDLYPCIMLMEEKTSFGNISAGLNYEKLANLKELIITEKKCGSCWSRYLCGGECLSGKLWNNVEQKNLRCILKRHIFALRLYMYDYIISNNKKYTF